LFASLGRAVPTLLVLALLGGVAIVGNETGWTIPKFSALVGGEAAEKDDWCEKHGVPESICVECQEDLQTKPPTYGWCAEHGVFDCPLEHPDVAQLPNPPPVTPADLERARRALAFAPRPQNNPKCELHPRRIQLASAAAVAKAGLEMVPVTRGPVVEFITAHGEITYDQTRIANLSSPLSGRVWRVEKDLGQPVKKGDVLALVDAVEVGRAKGEFLQALAQREAKKKALERLEGLFRQGAIPEAKYREGETDARVAEIRFVSAQQALVNLGLPVQVEKTQGLSPAEISRRIQFLGLPDALNATLDPHTTTANLIPIRAPLDGQIVTRKVVVGELVEPSKMLFVVADPRWMSLTLNVPMEEAGRLVLKQTVHFQPDGSADEVPATINWISTSVDPRTRTLQVRAALTNPAAKLRSNTFGSGRIVLREEPSTIVVPNEAVHWDGSCHIVFVQDKNFNVPDALKVFHVRSVRPGAKDGKQTEIIAGVLPGEFVAVQGSAMLRGELLKGNLGEGE
jgi:membrane fusion protein, heavy metal efflux system